jgi:hypothetical protein
MKGKISLKMLGEKRTSRKEYLVIFYGLVDIISDQCLHEIELKSGIFGAIIHKGYVRSDSKNHLEFQVVLRNITVHAGNKKHEKISEKSAEEFSEGRTISFIFTDLKKIGSRFITGRYVDDWQFAPGWSCSFEKQKS